MCSPGVRAIGSSPARAPTPYHPPGTEQRVTLPCPAALEISTVVQVLAQRGNGHSYASHDEGVSGLSFRVLDCHDVQRDSLPRHWCLRADLRRASPRGIGREMDDPIPQEDLVPAA